MESIRFKSFEIKTSKPKRFIDELETLCKKYSATKDGYFFEWIGE